MSQYQTWEPQPSPWGRVLPPLLLVAGIGLSLWAVPQLLRTADRERADRAAEAAADRLASSTVLSGINSALRDIARVTEPSVVHVSVAAEVRGRLGSRDYTQSGSGWIWDDQGNIVTNAHVVDGANALEVQLNDGTLLNAELVGLDLRTDIAVLRVKADGLTPAARSSRLPEQGDMVFAFGSPFEFRFSMSSGIVSGIGRSAGLAEVEYENFIQVDAAINPGNSGGPLVDITGKVIGMNTAIATGRGSTVGSGQFAGIGLAIPMQIVENVVDQILQHGEVAKGFLGVSVVDVGSVGRLQSRSPEFVVVANKFQGDGAVVSAVSADSPAAKAGLRVGDVIVGIGGRRISTRDEVLSQIGTSRPGTTMPLEVWRPDAGRNAGERVQLSAELGTLDPTVNAAPLVEGLQRMGLADLQDVKQPVRGVRVGRVVKDAPADGKVPVDSVIVGCDGQSVRGLDDLVIRLTRAFTTRPRLLGTPSVSFQIRLPNGAERSVELELR